jgi:hypothetical protein
MVHLIKPSPQDDVLLPRGARRLNTEANCHAAPNANGPLPGAAVAPPRIARFKGETKKNLRGAEELTAARIAQRFAPRVQWVATSGDRQFAGHMPPAPSSGGSPSRIRKLDAVLILVASKPDLRGYVLAGRDQLKARDTSAQRKLSVRGPVSIGRRHTCAGKFSSSTSR